MWHVMWNSVTIYGPQSELDRFKRLCIVPAPPGNREKSILAIDFQRIAPIPAGIQDVVAWLSNAWGTPDFPWNFRADQGQKNGTYSFAFDTVETFPTAIFERLAHEFPQLAFDCDCIEDFDGSMGFGWFNTPPGGEHFQEGYDVPEGYWAEGGCIKRDPMAELRYRALVAAMEETAAAA